MYCTHPVNPQITLNYSNVNPGQCLSSQLCQTGNWFPSQCGQQQNSQMMNQVLNWTTRLSDPKYQKMTSRPGMKYCNSCSTHNQIDRSDNQVHSEYHDHFNQTNAQFYNRQQCCRCRRDIPNVQGYSSQPLNQCKQTMYEQQHSVNLNCNPMGQVGCGPNIQCQCCHVHINFDQTGPNKNGCQNHFSSPMNHQHGNPLNVNFYVSQPSPYFPGGRRNSKGLTFDAYPDPNLGRMGNTDTFFYKRNNPNLNQDPNGFNNTTQGKLYQSKPKEYALNNYNDEQYFDALKKKRKEEEDQEREREKEREALNSGANNKDDAQTRREYLERELAKLNADDINLRFGENDEELGNARKQKQRAKSALKSKMSKVEEERLKKFNEQSRWIPNTSFQTYFGKPAFENYGNKNNNVPWATLSYGNHLKSHNINPQRIPNKPEFEQVYKSAQIASTHIDYTKDHIPRKCLNEYQQTEQEVDVLMKRMPILIDPNAKVNKIGVSQKPDLSQSVRFKNNSGRDIQSAKENNAKSVKRIQFEDETQAEEETRKTQPKKQKIRSH